MDTVPYLHSLFTPLKNPILDSRYFQWAKDPSVVFDGEIWHLYGSGACTPSGTLRLLYATAPNASGPWTEQEEIILDFEEKGCAAAPGMIFEPETHTFHLFLQTDCFRLEGIINHFTSHDGRTFGKPVQILGPLPPDEAGIYDPHPAEIGGRKYLLYSGMREVSFPHVYLAESETDSWEGPWKRRGKIIDHLEIPYHNRPDEPEYEWGLEGAQLIGLPDGSVLLQAVCFLSHEPIGRRQRLFLAHTRSVTGPYLFMGCLFEPQEGAWDSMENGHGSILVQGDTIHLHYQGKGNDQKWRCGYAQASVQSLLSLHS